MTKKTDDTAAFSPEPATEPVLELQPMRAWAEKAGHLPESLPGDRMHPVQFNRQAWLPRAACAHLKLTLDSPIDERTYLDAVAAVSAVAAR
jgi:hypothetical protein